MSKIEQLYQLAKEQYASLGVDTDAVLQKLATIKLSLPCWQGDDVKGFINQNATLSGGIQVTGGLFGAARNGNELRDDLDFVLSLIPGKHKVNLHALYAESDSKIDYIDIEAKYFNQWVNWAKAKGLGLDFNPSFFSHPTMSASGFTLSSADKAIRDFWLEHGKRSRAIAAYFGQELNQTAINNLWIPDGFKDYPVDRYSPRLRLQESLDLLFAKSYDKTLMQDAVESKLFGIGAEAYTVGSHEFYMGYAFKNRQYLCLDSGHFHQTESIADKLSSVALFAEGILLHLSRPMRWDSDHIVLFNDELLAIAVELVRHQLLNKTVIGLDFFDATINRTAALVFGANNTLKALLYSLLEPYTTLQQLELTGDYTSRMVWKEQLKSYPWGIVWNYYCYQHNIPSGLEILNAIKNYENTVLSKRI